MAKTIKELDAKINEIADIMADMIKDLKASRNIIFAGTHRGQWSKKRDRLKELTEE